MSTIEVLDAISKEQYVSENGEAYRAELMPGLTDREIDALAVQFPGERIPEDIRQLLGFARGFIFPGLQGIRFDALDQFGLEVFFPLSVQLAGDGLGNSWIVDIDADGNWGPVFFVCHDPAVAVKHSDNLAQFLQHVHEFGKDPSTSNLNVIRERIVFDLWQQPDGFIAQEHAKNSADTVLSDFASSLPDNYVVADLRDKPLQSGFAWGKYGPGVDHAKRHPTALLWAVEKPKPARKGLLSRLFGR